MNLGADQARGLDRIGQAPAAAPPGQAPAPASAAPAAAPYSPTTDLTAGQDANYTDWFANNDKVGEQIQSLAQQQAAQGNRKAAYLASMSGGNGGFYQSGQIAAGIAGQNTMNQGLLSNAQARSGIYSDKAAALGALGLGAQQYGNNMGLQTGSQNWQSGENRIREGREDLASEQEVQTGAINSQRDRANSAFDQRFDQSATSDARKDYRQLESAMDQAIAAGDFAKAQQIADQMTNFDYFAYEPGSGKRK